MWLGFVATRVARGTIGSFFTRVALHELGHGSVLQPNCSPKFFLQLYSLSSCLSPFVYTMRHTCHHRCSLYPEEDRGNVVGAQAVARQRLPAENVRRQLVH